MYTFYSISYLFVVSVIHTVDKCEVHVLETKMIIKERCIPTINPNTSIFGTYITEVSCYFVFISEYLSFCRLQIANYP